jgi:hypothetical protein
MAVVQAKLLGLKLSVQIQLYGVARASGRYHRDVDRSGHRKA